MLKASRLSIYTLTLAGFLFASGGADPASPAHESGWMEKWLSFDPGLFMWTIVTFLIVLFILKWKAWGPLMSALDKRAEDIKNALSAAESAFLISSARLSKALIRGPQAFHFNMNSTIKNVTIVHINSPGSKLSHFSIQPLSWAGEAGSAPPDANRKPARVKV
jgi:hypothetical protein